MNPETAPQNHQEISREIQSVRKTSIGALVGSIIIIIIVIIGALYFWGRMLDQAPATQETQEAAQQ